MAKKYVCPECGEEYDEPGQCDNCADDMGVLDDYHGGFGRFGPDLEEVEEDDEDFDNYIKEIDKRRKNDVEFHNEVKKSMDRINNPSGCSVMVLFIVVSILLVIYFLPF
jgi:hypothetical protein